MPENRSLAMRDHSVAALAYLRTIQSFGWSLKKAVRKGLVVLAWNLDEKRMEVVKTVKISTG